MEHKGKILDWKFSPIEMLGFAFSLASLAVGITMWSLTTFQSKQEAREATQTIDAKIESVEKRVERQEEQMNAMRTSLEGVAKNVEYIRGRLEPRSN